MAQTILVEGIAESQANVLLRLVLADGRSVRHVLTADEPSFVVPEQEGTLDVIGQSAVLDPWRRSRPGSRRERSALGRVRPRARTAGATHPDPRTKPGTPAAEHRGFVGEVESCAHEAPGLGRKALSFARKAKSLAPKAPGLAREVPEPDCRAKSPAREAPRLGREARRAGAEAEGLEAGAPGLGREA